MSTPSISVKWPQGKAGAALEASWKQSGHSEREVIDALDPQTPVTWLDLAAYQRRHSLDHA